VAKDHLGHKRFHGVIYLRMLNLRHSQVDFKQGIRIQWDQKKDSHPRILLALALVEQNIKLRMFLILWMRKTEA